VQDSIFYVARGADGVLIAEYNTRAGAWQTNRHDIPYFSDREGWDAPQFYKTFRAVAAGGRIILSGYGESQLFVYVYDPAAVSGKMYSFPKFSEEDLASPKYYETFQVVVDNRNDRIVLFLRGPTRIYTSIFNLAARSLQTVVQPESGWFSDHCGWDSPHHFRSLRLFVRNERLVIVARGADGIVAARYSLLLE
jgi:hypothetical protein